jgi:HEAT repeat protein
MRIRRAYCRDLALIAASLALCSCQRAPQSTPELIDDLRNNAQVRARAAAARTLGERKAVQAVPALITALKEPGPVQASAARALGDIQDRRALGPLIGLLGDLSPLTREAAAQGLGDLRDERAVKPLAVALKGGNEEAGPALAKIGEAAIGPLIDCLSEADSRDNASDALVTIGMPAVPALIQAFHSDPDEARIAAARALAQIDDPRAAKTLNAALNDDDLRLAAAVYKFLLRTDEPAKEDLLVKVLHNYGNSGMVKDLLRSGRPSLRLAAMNWANENSLSIEALDIVSGSRRRRP